MVVLCWLALGCVTGVAKEPEPLRLPVEIRGSPVRGNPNAPVTIAEFTDFECPFCAMAQSSLQEIFERYPDQVKLVFKNFPLPSHRNARQAHLASLCASEQGKFWEYRNELFAHQRALRRDDLLDYAKKLELNLGTFESCMDQSRYASVIEQDVQEGLALGMHGTPTFLINGRPLSGAQPFSSFQQLIEEELK